MPAFDFDLAIIYGGGGFKGMLQVPHIERYARFANIVMGTSVGSIQAAMIASGMIDELVDIWKETDEVSDWMRRQIDLWNGVYSLRPIVRKMRDLGALEGDLKIPAHVGVYDFQDSEHRLLPLGPHTPEDRRRLVVASSTIDPIHEDTAEAPIEPGGEDKELGDGGWFMHLPIPSVSLWRRCRIVHAVFCGPPPRIRPPRKPRAQVSGTIERFSAGLEELARAGNAKSWRRLRRRARQCPDTEVRVFFPPNFEGIGGSFEASRELAHSRYAVGQAMLEAPLVL